MARPRVDPNDETETIRVRVGRAVKEWLETEGGGSVSKAVRRLAKEEQWRREGKFVDIPKGEFDQIVDERKKLRGKLVKAGQARSKRHGPRKPNLRFALGSPNRPICGVRIGPGARCVQDKGHEGGCK